jgi:hypothetical protein
MKPLFILMLALSSFSLTSNATDVVSAKALKSFQTTFTQATEAEWTITENYYKVQFLLNGQTISAFYNEEGKLISVTRNISSLQLPIILQTELKKEYNNYWITDLFEMSNDYGAEYYLTLEDADNKTILKSSVGSNSWTVYLKLRK